jgi:nucleoside 2-deoxyribosyltransferase
MFVVMKLGDRHLDSAYAGVIRPLAESFGLKVLRVDEIQDSGLISSQILENIGQSRLVFLELSGGRPNCYYEAGYAHALGKGVIFSIRKGEQVHFDLAAHRFIQWDTEADLRKKLKKRLSAMEPQDEE